jgi:tRNA/rRNA methyltransferase
MPQAASAQGQRRGVLFGPERTGLDNDEVALADAVLTFPTNPAYGSLNLAQAVLLCGYEWFKAAHGDAPPAPAKEKAPALPAKREMTIAFFEYLEEHLDAAGFFKPEGKAPGMKRNLRNIFHRISMTEQDVSTLWGVVVRLVEGPRDSVQTRKRHRPPKPQP